MYKEKYLKYKNKYFALKNSLIGGKDSGKMISPTQNMYQSKEHSIYYSNFLRYCYLHGKKFNNLWMIIGAGNKGTDLTRFKDNYDIALTADEKNIDLRQKDLISFNIKENFIPKPTDNKIIGGENLRNKFSKIIYDWSTTKLDLNIFNNLEGYGEKYLQRGGIIYIDTLSLSGMEVYKLVEVNDTNYIISNFSVNPCILKDNFNANKDIFIRGKGKLLKEGEEINFYNLTWLFEKMKDDNSILKSDVNEYLITFNKSELHRERITARIREVLPEPTFTVEFLNGNYPNNLNKDGSDYIIDHYKITKNI